MMWIKLAAIALGGQLLVGAAASQTEPGVTADAIRLGIIGPFSGPAAEYSKAQVGAIAYLRSVSDAGGIHGRRLELFIEDDACDEAKGIAAARKLIFDANVFALASAFACSGPALAAKPVMIEAGIPVMFGGAASADLSTPVSRTLFQPTATTVDVGHAMVRFALSKPDVKKLAVISHANEWAKGYYEGAIAEIKTRTGAPPALDLTMERQSTNATPQVLRLREAAPDVVFAILYPAEMSIFLRDAKKLGLTTTFITGYGTTVEDQLRRTGDAAAVKNLYAAYLLSRPVDSPGMAKWRDLVKKYYPNEDITSANFSSLGGAQILVHAMEKAGRDLTREKLVEALNNIHDVESDVMAGKYTFTSADHAGQKELSFAGLEGSKVVIYSAWGKKTD